ncbi:hypothetical protein NP233_g3814 [Leucocoprinus birnbaumii]|uniref:Rhodanese domain-containing protein n=1 Tax=Leucocoprinus birnbaumii TaxID=56174 RepID=A0AAD5YTJ4_9AGAR|nr:hypothetical protein NP233_g3814 [Leucocoprinus birnbaumii]
MSFLLRRTSSKLLATGRSMSTSKILQAPLLLTPSETSRVLREDNGVLLDASWFMPNASHSGKVEFGEKRIPGAQFLDLDEVASPHELGLKHMMPEPQTFAEACGKFGIDSKTSVVIYDSHGVFSSPRALFMFRAFGHENSSILNGGLPAWVAEGGLLETGAVQQHPAKQYATPQLNQQMIRGYEQMVSNSALEVTGGSASELVLDARSKDRQKQTSSDGLEYTVFRQPDDLNRELESAVGAELARSIIEGKQPVTTTCGSGMTAAVLWLGLRLLGVKDIALYDESWTGYAMRPSSKIIKN